jgi:large subunit ribosomal protein L29
LRPRELRDLSDDELEEKLHERRQELFNLRFQFATRQLTNHARMHVVRRDIARINTLTRQREILAAVG